LISAQNIRKAFADTVAVDDLSLEISAGQTLGLLGPNGAGKSTTINMLIGLVRPDSGQIEIDGNPDPSSEAIRMKVGVAPQTISLYEELTAEENLAFFGKLYSIRGARLKERVDWALEFAKLTDRRKHRVGTFSGGMKRRVNFAAALIHEPKIVLLDEPTVGVDPQSRNHIFECVQKLQQDGLTVIYTTHYMEEAERLCDRVAIIDHGKLLDIDTVAGLIAKHGGKSVLTGELTERPKVELPGTIDENLNWRWESEKPLDDLAKVSTTGSAFKTLQVNQPDLESVFLSLTGRTLRD